MFFIHHEHGATNAPESDAPALEEQGWKASTVEEWFRMNGKGYVFDGEQADPEQEQPAKRRGRPPKAK
jgi:hypothetical protein